MRPSDENQPATTRPNLLSSTRRSGNSDDSILAKMDRARGLSTRARTVWLVGAGGLAVLLIAAVGMLAYTNAGKPRVLPVDAATAPPPGSPDMPHNDAPAQIVNALPRDEAAPSSRDDATTAPARYDAGTAPAPLPPLVTLPRTPGASAHVSLPAPPPVYAARVPARVAAVKNPDPPPSPTAPKRRPSTSTSP